MLDGALEELVKARTAGRVGGRAGISRCLSANDFIDVILHIAAQSAKSSRP